MAIVAQSCKKNKDLSAKTETKTIKVGKQKMSVIKFLGIKINVEWVDGCFSSSREFYENGNLKSEAIKCTPGCKICKGNASFGSGLILTDGNGTKSLDIQYSSNNEVYGGMVGLSEDGTSIICAVDRTKMTDAAFSKFAGDNLSLDNGYCLGYEIIEQLGLSDNNLEVPAGTYELFVDGNIVFWQVPVSR